MISCSMTPIIFKLISQKQCELECIHYSGCSPLYIPFRSPEQRATIIMVFGWESFISLSTAFEDVNAETTQKTWPFLKQFRTSRNVASAMAMAGNVCREYISIQTAIYWAIFGSLNCTLVADIYLSVYRLSSVSGTVKDQPQWVHYIYLLYI